MDGIDPQQVIQVDVLTLSDDDSATMDDVLAEGADVGGLDITVQLQDGTGRRLYGKPAADLLRRLGYGKSA